jgi:hypothetical protein
MAPTELPFWPIEIAHNEWKSAFEGALESP